MPESRGQIKLRELQTKAFFYYGGTPRSGGAANKNLGARI